MKEQTYGYFPGGDYDPRKFEPDRDVNTPAEIAAWRNACETWERGKRPALHRSGMQCDGVIRCGSELGMGTYEIEWELDEGAEEDVPAEVAA